MDVMLRTRHGTNLLMRGFRWMIADDAELHHVYVGHHVLAALGLNNRILLAAAADRFNGVVDFPEALKKDGQQDTAWVSRPETIQYILHERGLDFGSTYHSEGGA